MNRMMYTSWIVWCIVCFMVLLSNIPMIKSFSRTMRSMSAKQLSISRTIPKVSLKRPFTSLHMSDKGSGGGGGGGKVH